MTSTPDRGDPGSRVCPPDRRRPLLRRHERRPDADADDPDPDRPAAAAEHHPRQRLVGHHRHAARRRRRDAHRRPARGHVRQAARARGQLAPAGRRLPGLRAVRLAAADADRPGAAGPGHGLHPGGHLADARGHAARDDQHRDRVDERHPRRRRRHRPAAVGLGGRELRLARAVLDVGRPGLRDGADRRGPGPPRARRRTAAASTSSVRVGLAVGLLGALVAISKGNEWGWGHGRTIGLLVGGVRRARGVGLLRAAPARPAVRPPRDGAGSGAADQPRGRRDRLRHDGPGRRRTPAAADADRHRLRTRADHARGRALDGARRSDDAAVRPGVQRADDAHRAQAHADDRRRGARRRLPRRLRADGRAVAAAGRLVRRVGRRRDRVRRDADPDPRRGAPERGRLGRRASTD